MLGLLPLQGVSYPSNFPQGGCPGLVAFAPSGRYQVITDNHFLFLYVFIGFILFFLDGESKSHRPPADTYSDVINIGLPSLRGRAGERPLLGVLILLNQLLVKERIHLPLEVTP